MFRTPLISIKSMYLYEYKYILNVYVLYICLSMCEFYTSRSRKFSHHHNYPLGKCKHTFLKRRTTSGIKAFNDTKLRDRWIYDRKDWYRKQNVISTNLNNLGHPFLCAQKLGVIFIIFIGNGRSLLIR